MEVVDKELNEFKVEIEEKFSKSDLRRFKFLRAESSDSSIEIVDPSPVKMKTQRAKGGQVMPTEPHGPVSGRASE